MYWNLADICGVDTYPEILSKGRGRFLIFPLDNTKSGRDCFGREATISLLYNETK